MYQEKRWIFYSVITSVKDISTNVNLYDWNHICFIFTDILISKQFIVLFRFPCHTIILWTLQKYEEYYEGEEEINKNFNTFVYNFRSMFGGHNTVQAQIGFPSKNGQYRLVGFWGATHNMTMVCTKNWWGSGESHIT